MGLDRTVSRPSWGSADGEVRGRRGLGASRYAYYGSFDHCYWIVNFVVKEEDRRDNNISKDGP